MQQSHSPNKYSQALPETDQAAVVWGSLVHAIRNSLRLDVTEMS